MTSRTDNDNLKDHMLRSAVERNMEIIGKAARHVSESFLHWSGIAGGGPQKGGK